MQNQNHSNLTPLVGRKKVPKKPTPIIKQSNQKKKKGPKSGKNIKSQATAETQASLSGAILSQFGQTAPYSAGVMSNQLSWLSQIVGCTGSYIPAYSGFNHPPAFQTQGFNLGNQAVELEDSKEDAKNLEAAGAVEVKIPILTALANKRYRKHVPVLWMTEDLKALIKLKRAAEAIYKENGSNENRKKYVELRRQCNRMCRDAQRRHSLASVESGEAVNQPHTAPAPAPAKKKKQRVKASAIPKKKRMNDPWVTDELKELIRMKKEAQKAVEWNNSEINRKKYFYLKKTCNNHCLLVRQKYDELLKKQNQDQQNEESQKNQTQSQKKMTGWPRRGGSVFSRLDPVPDAAVTAALAAAAAVTAATTEAATEAAIAEAERRELYSPTEHLHEEEQPTACAGESADGQKRLSAFDRLGPLGPLGPPAPPNKPKLTINLSLGSDQPVREVVQEAAHVPFHLHAEALATDEVVRRYLPVWPWRNTFHYTKMLTARASKSVMLMEKEQVEEAYARTNYFVMVSIRGYPASWTKEDTLDALLDNLKGRSFIPCFVEFSRTECKLLVSDSRAALLEIHSLGFCVRRGDVELALSTSPLHLTVHQLDLVPRTVLKELVERRREGTVLDLKAFTLQTDVSHLVYYPLSRVYNQRELQSLCGFEWRLLTRLDLSGNRLTSLDGFNLPSSTPNLRSLDVSHNRLPSLPALLPSRGLPLRSLWLQGNPLCLDVQRDTYVEAAKTLFSSLRELDGEPLPQSGQLPRLYRNYCPEAAAAAVETYLHTFYPLLDSAHRQRALALYHKDVLLTVTARTTLRHEMESVRCVTPLFAKCRVLEQRVYDVVRGAAAVSRVLERWPRLQHDPATFTVDVLQHTDEALVVKVCGVVKVVSASLAEDEPLLVFSRTALLLRAAGEEYRVRRELLCWDRAPPPLADRAFQLLRIQNKPLDLKFDSTPNEEMQEELIEAFMKLTELEAKPSRRCLEAKDWHFKNALEYFMKLLKLDNVEFLYKSD